MPLSRGGGLWAPSVGAAVAWLTAAGLCFHQQHGPPGVDRFTPELLMYPNPVFLGFPSVQLLLKRGKGACPPLRGKQEKQKLRAWWSQESPSSYAFDPLCGTVSCGLSGVFPLLFEVLAVV